jgi:hypothetical protein
MQFGDRLRRVGGHLEENRVRVAEGRLAAGRGEPVERLRRLCAALRDVPEADDLLDPDALDISSATRKATSFACWSEMSARRTPRDYRGRRAALERFRDMPSRPLS